MSTTVYISIGNSDDKLTQAEWAEFYRRTNLAIRNFVEAVHGQWVSEPASAWQNACWCIEITELRAYTLKHHLSVLAAEYRQDSIAWAPATTEFLAAVDA
jgi:hypothetical protein